MEKTTKTIKKLLTFSPSIWKKAEELREVKGFLSDGEAVRFAITEAHDKHCLDYSGQSILAKQNTKPQTEEEKAHKKIIAKEAERNAYQKREHEKAVNMVNMVNNHGEFDFIKITDNGDMVEFFNRKGESFLKREITYMNELSLEYFIDYRNKNY